MLNSARTTLICLLLAVGLLAAPVTANAAGPEPTVHPCAQLDVCIGINDGTSSTPAPGHTASGGGGDGVVIPKCTWNGQEWPCWDPDLGWFSTSDGCYYLASDPQPPAGDPAWAGHQPGDGLVYEVYCRGTGGQLSSKPLQFFATPPVTPVPLVSPRNMMMQVIKEWGLAKPAVHIAPSDTAVVGSPVWLWYDAADNTLGDISTDLSLNGLTITVSRTRSDVVWNPNDGSGEFTCKNATTEYRSDLPASTPVPCPHTYKASSALVKDQKFYLTGYYNWHIVATRHDTTPATVFADFDIRIDLPQVGVRVAEVQLVN